MNVLAKTWSIFLVGSVLLTGCSDQEHPVAPSAAPLAPSAAQTKELLLPAEPAGARDVIAVRKEAKTGEEVVVVGHIAGSEEPLVKGRAAFTIVDLSLEPCEEDRPWVYCCTPKEDLIAAMVMVKFVDEQGKTVTQDARQLLGVKEWSTVVVRGRAQRDDEGNFTAIIASGLYVKP